MDSPAPDDWEDFSVDRVPRPIVLLGSVAKHTGYTTDEAKMAATAGNLTLDTPLPAGRPSPRPVVLPDATRSLPLISAEEAFGELRANPDAKTVEQTKPLRITRVELGSTTFSTDRGDIELPAWLFRPVDALGPIAWPAVGPDAFWRPGKVVPAAAPGEQGGTCVHDMMLRLAPYPVTLDAPLGSRVLLDGEGHVHAVQVRK
jgi:hypothetical protein